MKSKMSSRSWIGHVWRSNGIMKDMLNWKPEGKTNWAGLRKGGWTSPTRISGYLGLITNDREEWKRLCGAVMGLNGL